jgi:hypothetical protein
VVVAWRRGSLRAGLAGLLAAMAMVGAVGALWLLAGDGAGDDAAAPIDDSAMPDRRDVDAGATGADDAGAGGLGGLLGGVLDVLGVG